MVQVLNAANMTLYFSHLIFLWHRNHALQILLLSDHRQECYDLSTEHSLQPTDTYKIDIYFKQLWIPSLWSAQFLPLPVISTPLILTGK